MDFNSFYFSFNATLQKKKKEKCCLNHAREQKREERLKKDDDSFVLSRDGFANVSAGALPSNTTQRTLALNAAIQCTTWYRAIEREYAMQSQWRVVERQDARGSEDRGQKTGGEDLAILPSFLHTFFYTRLLRLPTYSSNHTHRTTHRNRPASLNKPPP